MKRIPCVIVFLSGFAASAGAQQNEAVRGRARTLAEATRLGSAGDISAARRLTDSLAKIVTSEDDDYADVLLARATYAPSVLDASLDYEKIVSELPRTAAAKTGLLRLAQRALISSDAVKALDYLQRMLRDFPDDSSVAETQYWRARALLDSHDVAAACAANHEATTHAQASHSPLTPMIESQGFVACGEAPLVQATVQPKPATPKNTKPIKAVVADTTKAQPSLSGSTSFGKEYAVQVAAFGTRRDADAMAERLKQRGLDAHVDGSAKPYRVRIGHYSSYADAAKAMRDLKSRKISGFVSESER